MQADLKVPPSQDKLQPACRSSSGREDSSHYGELPLQRVQARE